MRTRTIPLYLTALVAAACGFNPAGVSLTAQGIDPAGSEPPADGGPDSGRVAVVCDPLIRFCDEDYLVRCKEDGSGFAATRCAQGCAAARAECHVCSPSSPPVCADNFLTVCSPNRTWDTQICRFGCNSPGTGCNACDDRAPPFCQGKTILRCVAGAMVIAPCHGLCRGNRCCEDRDGDGISTCDGDCDDQDEDVFFGQTAYFESPRPDGSYDYDCNGQDEPAWPRLAQCDTFKCESGWVNVVPACGAEGLFLDCNAWLGSCESSEVPQTQACR